MKKILLIEDDLMYQALIEELLLQSSYEVSKANDASTGLLMCRNNDYDLVIADLDLGGISGFQLIQMLFKIKPLSKVVILTGSERDNDEVNGLDLPVLDYIRKPVSLNILLKRIEKALMQSVQVEEQIVFSKFDKIKVNIHKRQVHQNGELVELRLKEFELLIFFLQNKNTILTRETIFTTIWRDASVGDNRTIDVHIRALRKALKITRIRSIWGVGYEWSE